MTKKLPPMVHEVTAGGKTDGLWIGPDDRAWFNKVPPGGPEKPGDARKAPEGTATTPPDVNGPVRASEGGK